MKWLGDRVKRTLAVVLIIAGVILAVVSIAVGIGVARAQENQTASELQDGRGGPGHLRIARSARGPAAASALLRPARTADSIRRVSVLLAELGD